jgi:hypothetical protein
VSRRVASRAAFNNNCKRAARVNTKLKCNLPLRLKTNNRNNRDRPPSRLPLPASRAQLVYGEKEIRSGYDEEAGQISAVIRWVGGPGGGGRRGGVQEEGMSVKETSELLFFQVCEAKGVHSHGLFISSTFRRKLVVRVRSKTK